MFKSSATFDISVLVILPDKNFSILEILGWKINGDEMFPACGEKSESIGLISNGSDTSAARWPWHVSLWKMGIVNMSYICGGSIINKKWFVSAGKLKPQSIQDIF